MMLSKFIFILLFLFLGINSFAVNKDTISLITDSGTVIQNQTKIEFNFLPKISLFSNKKAGKKNKSKLVAGLLAITLGPFGVHRLYLGTSPKVPIAYTLTLGGGFFILPLIDIFYIILSRKPEDIENNNHLFIWNKKKTQK
jgi:TM2 domain-containing membrane protein YozV